MHFSLYTISSIASLLLAFSSLFYHSVLPHARNLNNNTHAFFTTMRGSTDFGLDRKDYTLQIWTSSRSTWSVALDTKHLKGMTTSGSPRVTTAWGEKWCDYVLAIFPDIKGYRVPLNARAYTFQELLLDAIDQLGGEGPLVALKVLDTLLYPAEIQQKLTIPFILDRPDSVSEAFYTLYINNIRFKFIIKVF